MMSAMTDKPPAGVGPDANPLLFRTERENEAIVRSFCDAWSAMSPEAICNHLHEDCVYSVYEDGPIKRGIPEIRSTLEQFMTRWREVRFNVFRVAAMGALVLHERQEVYSGREGHPDWEFNVTGLLLIRNGKILGWRDYALPGARQIFAGV
jgi:limonene-1,2-epoxide hydrolase